MRTGAIYLGDCLDVLPTLDAESVDAVVTDPPYGIHFMGKSWDKFGNGIGVDHHKTRERSGSMHAGHYDLRPSAMREFQEWTRAWATEALRVLKPGGHLVSSCSTRTYHRMATGVEDAGFEVRDCLMWLYGSGFPKSLDVAKAIDKSAGHWRGRAGAVASDNGAMSGANYERTAKGEPVTAAAAAWDGWGTALKPACEPIVLARKPLRGTVAANVLAHGTGALNIDACRIGTGGGTTRSGQAPYGDSGWRTGHEIVETGSGRWPANVILDAEAAERLDAHSGERGGGFGVRGAGPTDGLSSYALPGQGQVVGFGDLGGASRFFYTAKAASSERSDGLGARNTHPTVKPVDLMAWLIRLVTPPGGIALDPFLGSGSTAVAAQGAGFQWVGIEREREYAEIAAARIGMFAQIVEAAA